jgi:hypothetical protein
MTTTRQTFTPGTAPVAGYESSFFFRNTITTVGTMTTCEISQFIEDVRTDAGQTITISFWAKADSARNTTSFITQTFGSGGSSPVDVNPSGNTFSLTTSWQRFSFTLTMPSISGKTIGTNSYVRIQFRQAVAAGSVFDFWGLQVEQGSTATTFQTATGTIQGELAACQRYYYRQTAAGITEPYAFGSSYNATGGYVFTAVPATMRIKPSSVEFSNVQISDWINNFATTPTVGFCVNNQVWIAFTGTGMTGNRPYVLNASNATSYLAFNAEL